MLACLVTAPPAALHLDAFYTKYCNADGLAVVAAASVSDEAVQQATRLAEAMMSRAPAARAALVKSGVRFGVVGETQQTTDMPEYRHWPTSANERGRGYGAGSDTMLSSTAEENLLCHEYDKWRGESIFVHEFGHTLKNWGLERSDPSFATRVKAAYDAAIANGKYRGFYAATNPEEYWAEGVQDYFDVHQRRDPNDINTKAQLRAYDPALFAILDQVFGGVVLPDVCPAPVFAKDGRYRITNVVLGPSLSVDGDHMTPTGNYSGQYFSLLPARGGFFRLATEYEPRPSKRRYRITPIENGIYRITGENGEPLAPAPNQEWRVTAQTQ